jgi:ribosomal protein S18 acetylase RimI-like enzyme
MEFNMDDVVIRALGGDEEARAAATIMANSEVWQRLARTFDHTYAAVTNPQAERVVAVLGEQVVGIMILGINVPLIKGYVAALAVHEDYRGRGIGSRLLKHAEERIGRVSPHVFLCVSSFNDAARRFYERHGFRQVGELKDYAVAGKTERLMLKSQGPWESFQPAGETESM